jgi:serine/threonine-protein kinase RsbW
VSAPDVEISIPPRPEYVGLVRHVVGAAARLGGMSLDCVDYAKIAVSEAATNAVTSTGRAESSEPVSIIVELGEDRVVLAIADRGIADPRGDGSDDEPSSLDFSFDGGLSIPLLEGLADEVEISEREGGGSTVRLTVVDPKAGQEGAAAD